MRRIWALIIIILVLISSAAVFGVQEPESEIQIQLEAPQVPPLPSDSKAPVALDKIGNGYRPDIKAASAILVDSETGQILYSKKPNYRRPVASTTKIMTALLVLEHCDLNSYVTASKEASLIPYSGLHLVPGEKLTVRDMLIGMMLRSANDAAYAFAEYVSGSPSRFIVLMNAKAKALGLKDTHFKNPNGLYVPGHYSTAYDLSALARAAIKNPTFNEIVAMRRATLHRSKNTKDVVVYKRTPFLKYPGADGIKSGYTKEAGYCYVGSATRGGWRLISVVLKSDNASRDSIALMDYGFNNFQRVVLIPREKQYRFTVVGGKSKFAAANPKEQLYAVVAKGVNQKVSSKVVISEVKAPIKKGQQVGKIIAYVNGTFVKSVSLVAEEDINKSFTSVAWQWLRFPAGIFLAGSVLNRRRRVIRGRTPAKNTLIRRRRFTPAVRGDNFRR